VGAKGDFVNTKNGRSRGIGITGNKRGEPGEAENLKRGATVGEANYQTGKTHLCTEQSLEVDGGGSGRQLSGWKVSFTKRQGGSLLPMRREGRVEGEAPEQERPGRGCGMKQAHEPECGGNRRETEKV